MRQLCAGLVQSLRSSSHLSAKQQSELFAWWQQLSPSQQTEIELYFDPLAEEPALTSQTINLQWEPLPITLGGVFIDEEDLVTRRIWSQDIFDYFDDDPRRFLHDNNSRDETFEWRHYNWQNAPVY
jgi:hypothetical protein